VIQHYASPEKEIERDEVCFILDAINKVVEDKAYRLDAYTRQLQSGANTHTLEEIVAPIRQITFLARAIMEIFNELFKETNIKFGVGIMSVKDKMPIQWECYHPYGNGQREPVDFLKNPESTIMHAINERKPILIEDVSKELLKPEGTRQYVEIGSQDEGSQLCYPLINPLTEQVVYVIAIKGNTECCLLERYMPIYEWVICHFIPRIHLEHSFLTVMKKGETL